MGTIKRLNDAQQRLQDAENAMPGAYDDQYAQGIADTLDKMGTASGAGFDFTTADSGYKDALTRMVGNANAGADAAAATADALSGGYGADYAKSAADQAAAAQTANTGSTLAAARADALAQWQQELAGAGDQLDTLLGQRALERGEYDSSVSNAANWCNYLYDRTQQARQENSDFWGNVWNVVKNVGAAALEGYDAYKGYRQQDWENAFALRQYNDNLSRTELSDQMAALQQAASYKEAGFDDAAKQILNQYGLTDTMLDSWQGLSQVDKDKLDYLTTAAGLAGSGYDTAANNYLQMAGLPTGSVDSYSTIANRLNQADLAKYASQLAISNRYKTTTRSGSGGTSRSTKSGSSTKSRSSKVDGYTQPQLNTMFKEYSNMKPDDQRRSYYEDTLADAGRIQRLTGTGNPGKANGTAWEQGMYNARKMANSGYSQNQIANELANNTSLSSDQISAIMNQIDYEWRGTK